MDYRRKIPEHLCSLPKENCNYFDLFLKIQWKGELYFMATPVYFA